MIDFSKFGHIKSGHTFYAHTYILNFVMCNFVAIDISFRDSVYSLNETGGHVQPVLVLSNPSSTAITVQVTDNSDTATGELD